MAGDIRTFRDLVAWQRAMALTCEIYRETGNMPKAERFELTQQMRRAAVSVPSNIAEGCARQSTKVYLKFLRTARGSLAELMTPHEIAITLSMIQSNEKTARLLAETDRVLQALIRSLEAKMSE